MRSPGTGGSRCGRKNAPSVRPAAQGWRQPTPRTAAVASATFDSTAAALRRSCWLAALPGGVLRRRSFRRGVLLPRLRRPVGDLAIVFDGLLERRKDGGILPLV